MTTLDGVGKALINSLSFPTTDDTRLAPGLIELPRSTPAPAAVTLLPRVQPALERRRQWERRYAWRLRMTDAAVVLCITLLTAVIDHRVIDSTGSSTAFLVAGTTAGVWLVTLALAHTSTAGILGWGAAEYVRVAHATAFAFGIIAMGFAAFQMTGMRYQLFLALPLGLIVLLAGRCAWRRWLLRQRYRGRLTARAILTGTPEDIKYVLESIDRERIPSYTVIGTAPTSPLSEPITVNGRSYPIVGTMDSVATHVRSLGADSLIVATVPGDDPEFIRRLSWDLEGTASELVISGPLVDVTSPRVSLRPVNELLLIQLAISEFEGGGHWLKRATDVAVSMVALVAIGLALPFLAIAIKADSRGPLFFRQQRIGRDGRAFDMIKFRTMHTDAEARLAELQANNEGAGPLFKMKNDPRTTRVGAVLRKYSLDELPQFWNVLRGEMSVVGPRPPLPTEVREYDGKVNRRLYTRPGITGLWQVNGRSDLSWDESVRLDLRYVENWSLAGDLDIMWRTVKVMIAPKGAY